MAREKLGGVPYEATKEGRKIKLRFFPKGEEPKNPDILPEFQPRNIKDQVWG